MIKHRLRRHTLKTEDGIGDWSYVLCAKTGNYMEAGYIYAPYIPLITNTTMYDPQNISEDYFLPQHTSHSSRYHTITVNNNFYDIYYPIDTDGDMLLPR
jgi:hypothetical protein